MVLLIIRYTDGEEESMFCCNVEAAKRYVEQNCNPDTLYEAEIIIT